ncbi:LTA synthase family protein [Weissella confusa]|uniref:LTA synthase family protein n=1 Tax=Weissella confusa TaxID=1583 RepID=UPI00223B9AA2|nr:LTA synthase family protein [Weissella confusa]MCT0025097.1 LTA synthase family protein [Weissella confusa]
MHLDSHKNSRSYFTILLLLGVFIILAERAENYIFVDHPIKMDTITLIVYKFQNIISQLVSVFIMFLILVIVPVTRKLLTKVISVLMLSATVNFLVFWAQISELPTANFSIDLFRKYAFSSQIQTVFFEFLIASFIYLLLADFFSKKMIGLKKRLDKLSINESVIIKILITVVAYLSPTSLEFLLSQFYNGTYWTTEGKMPLVTSIGEKSFALLILRQAILFVVLYWLSGIIVRAVNSFLNMKTGKELAMLSAAFLSLIFSYTVQVGIYSNYQLRGRSFLGAGLFFQGFVFFLIFMIMYILVNRFVYGTGLVLITGLILTVANHLKYISRLEPIFVSDLDWLKDAKSLFGFIDPKVLVLFAGVLIFISIGIHLIAKRVYSQPIFSGMKARLVGLVMIAVTFVIISLPFKPGGYQNIPLISKFYTLQNSEVLWQGNAVTASFKSVPYVWFRQIFGTVMDEPKNYSKKTVLTTAKKYELMANRINKSRGNEISNQTVIYILSESLANPNRIKNVKISENPLQNIDRIKSEYTGGLMISDGFGGGTANMEIQTLTGLSRQYFGEDVSVINNEVLPNMKFLPSISDEWKSKKVIHFANANSYNRKVVYNRLGFDDFYALTGTDKTIKNPKMVNRYVSDETTYDNVLKNLSGKPTFLSVMTMQNHAPWIEKTEGPIKAKGAGFTENQNQTLTNYANDIYQTDVQTKRFLDKLSKRKEKISVVFYGDHLPGLYPESVFNNNESAKYQTDYFIWTNYKTDKKNYL